MFHQKLGEKASGFIKKRIQKYNEGAERERIRRDEFREEKNKFLAEERIKESSREARIWARREARSEIDEISRPRKGRYYEGNRISRPRQLGFWGTMDNMSQRMADPMTGKMPKPRKKKRSTGRRISRNEYVVVRRKVRRKSRSRIKKRRDLEIYF